MQKPKLNWDRLLDGETYVLDLDQIGWPTGLADLRAKVHYEVDRRRGVAHTRKLAPSRLEIYAEGARVSRVDKDGPCNCGAPFWDFHRIVCSSLGKRAATIVGGGTYQETMQLRKRVPAPQDQPPSTVEPPEDEAEALLGPCTCGQDPLCLPSCERFS